MECHPDGEVIFIKGRRSQFKRGLPSPVSACYNLIEVKLEEDYE
jgi:hypothetical protein